MTPCAWFWDFAWTGSMLSACPYPPFLAFFWISLLSFRNENQPKVKSQKGRTKPKNCMNSTKEYSEQFEGVTVSLPSKTRVLRQIAPESSPERSAKSLWHSFFVVPFLSQIQRKTSARPSKSWKNTHFGTDMPRGRPPKNFGPKNFGLIFRSFIWSAANGGLRDGCLSTSEDIWGKRPFSSVFWISQVLFAPSGKGRKRQKKGENGRFQPISGKGGQTPLKPPFVTPPFAAAQFILLQFAFWGRFPFFSKDSGGSAQREILAFVSNFLACDQRARKRGDQSAWKKIIAQASEVRAC